MYTKDTLHNLKAFKATTTLKANINQVVDILKDVAAYKEWYNDIVVSQVLESEGNNVVYYFEVKVPLFSNRDGINRLVFDYQKDKVTVQMFNVADYLEMEKGLVRFPIAQGSWILTDLGSGKTAVEHQYVADPAGSIPKWIVQSLIVDGPVKSLTNLQKRINKLTTN